LVDFHPVPQKALVDGPQALYLDELPIFLEDVHVTREAYEKRCLLAEKLITHEAAS
jgi:3-deoxy-7-phosphoheptulonate synthase